MTVAWAVLVLGLAAPLVSAQGGDVRRYLKIKFISNDSMQLQIHGLNCQAKKILRDLEQATPLCVVMTTNCGFLEEKIIWASIKMIFGSFPLKLYPGPM